MGYAGTVGKIRELNRGVEAEVCVGLSAEGSAIIRVCSSSKRVQEAMETLREVLRQEAHDLLVAAQREQLKRGRRAIGVEEAAS